VWRYIPVIPTCRGLRQKNYKFEASLGYIVNTCFKNESVGLEV
jgi:hypothetical protein